MKEKLVDTTRDREGLLEVFKRLSQSDDLLSKPILSRHDSDCNIGSVLSPHDVRLMMVVKLRKKEGISLLLLRYSVLLVAPRTSLVPSIGRLCSLVLNLPCSLVLNLLFIRNNYKT